MLSTEEGGVRDYCPLKAGPIYQRDSTVGSGRVIITRYMGPVVTTIVGSVCTTDLTGRKT